jgi:hypothetical protein
LAHGSLKFKKCQTTFSATQYAAKNRKFGLALLSAVWQFGETGQLQLQIVALSLKVFVISMLCWFHFVQCFEKIGLCFLLAKSR